MPWDEIGTPSKDYNVRLAAHTGKIPVYWGKDIDGHCLLLIELDGDHGSQFRKDNFQVNGIRLDFRVSDEGQQRLVLTLEKHIDQDIFSSLCKTLINTLSPVVDPAIALSVAMTHIKRWKAFLAAKIKRLLSPDEIRGLFGELLFLRTLYLEHLPEKMAMDSWCGIQGLHQDFIFGNNSVEIKTLSGRENNSVRISSENQLESLSDNLFLIIYRINEIPDSESSLSLNELVQLIESELTDADVIESFSENLSGFGYIPVPEYDKPKLLMVSSQTYRVTEGFPCLVRTQLPEGITRVSYEIELEKIIPFIVDQEQIFRRQSGGTDTSRIFS